MNQISLDINKADQIINEPVVLRVGDKDQTITANLLKDGQPYTSFTTATFFANKPSGAIVANDPANISGGVITYSVPAALVNEFGKITDAYFLIDGKVSTEKFVIAVLQGVNISDDLNDYIPGMENLNVIYDKWKDKLDGITRELTGIDAPKEVKNVVNNVLKDYVNQLNDLKSKLTTLQTDVNNLKIPQIGGRNYLLGTDTPLTVKGTNIVNQNPDGDYRLSVRNAAALFKINLNFTLSFDWTATPESTGQFIVQFSNTPWLFYQEPRITVDKDHLSGHYSYSFTEPENVTEEKNGLGNSLHTRLDNFTGSITLSNMQLEPGNIETSYSPAPEDKVSVSDTDNWQKQRIFRTGDYLLNACPQGTDFGEFLKSDSVPLGLSIIRDRNTSWNWRIVKESSNYIYGLAQDAGGTVYHLEVSNGVYQGYKKVISNLAGQIITATDDTGKTVKLKITGIS